MIEFLSVKWKNFLSTGDTFTSIDLTKSKTNLIVGQNGMGKSTMCDAICFALYGKAFRPINKPQLVNSVNKKGLHVELEFRVRKRHYRIVRGIKPNLFEIYEDENLIKQTSSVADYQSWLEMSVLQISYKAFTQIVMIGSANYVPFMSLQTPDRRKVIEDLLDLTIFSQMNKRLKKVVDATLAEQKRVSFDTTITENAITSKKRALASIRESSEALAGQIEKEIAETEANIESLSNSRKSINESRTALLESHPSSDSLYAKITSLNTAITKVERSIATIKKEEAFFHDNLTCPTCTQSITEQFKAEKATHHRDQREPLEVALKTAKDTRDELEVKLNRANEINKEAAKMADTIAEITANINAQQSMILKYRTNLATVKKTDSGEVELKEEISKLEKSLRALQKESMDLIRQREVEDVAGSFLKDAGIKTRVIKQYVPIMNDVLQKYLSIMEFNVTFELDENFSETITTRNMEEFSYNSFSEGEKARIELALLFTWRHIVKMRNSADTNVLFMDEVFDGSLDAQGGDDLLSIIDDVSEKCHIYVITHKSDSYTERFERKITFTKSKGFSVVAEDDERIAA